MFEISPQDWTAVALSLRIAVVATMVSLPFGIAVATLLARKDFWGKTLVEALIYLPLVLPPVVTGYLLLITLGRHAPVGAFLADHFGIVFAFRWTGAVISCGVMAFPSLKGKTKAQAQELFQHIHQAIITGAPASEQLGKLAIFAGVHNFPSRVKCAILPWHAVVAALEGKPEPVTTDTDDYGNK